MNKWKKNKQLFKWPSQCLLCDAPGFAGRDLCQDCHKDLPRSPHRCRICALPLSATVNSVCGHCIKEKPYFDQSVAVFDYARPVNYLVHRLKYQQNLQFGRLLGQFLCETVKSEHFPEQKPQLLLPVPLHTKRLRQRGFNQAVELSRVVSKALSIPINTRACVRARDTGHQSSMSAKQRKSNVYQSFNVIEPFDAAHVAIIDDVMTTGATCNELARTLKQAGVSQVSIWVVARAL